MTSLSQFKKVLILSPHTDDGEFGCGATIAKLLQQKNEVHYVAFSSADESVPKNFPHDILRHEVLKATAELGIPQHNVEVLNFPVRHFNDHRQDILEYLVKINREMKPDLIFMPSRHDFHQDHAVISQEAIRAFKCRTILGYELIWNNLKFDNQCFVHINQEQLSSKINAVNCYESQKHKHYSQEDLIRSLARVRGVQVAVNYAELFEVIRWVVY
ncbi:MAG: PIG-L family deacetylase [Gammaproteobacteria bacterium]|nr:PIG-L family deacetylase [Gammaproteobacteria bacterium]